MTYMGVGSGHLGIIELLMRHLPDENYKNLSHKDWSSSRDSKQVHSVYKSKAFSLVRAAKRKDMCTSVFLQYHNK
jgi:hypothetical protein